MLMNQGHISLQGPSGLVTPSLVAGVTTVLLAVTPPPQGHAPPVLPAQELSLRAGDLREETCECARVCVCVPLSVCACASECLIT